jgi:hypothetical protein
MCGWYLESLEFTHMWMVLRELRVCSRVNGTLRVYSLLTCGWSLDSLQFTHMWMVHGWLTVYSRVDGT